MEQNNGTVHGATHTFERYEFDGEDDYIQKTGATILDMVDNYTVSFWVQLEELGVAMEFVDFQDAHFYPALVKAADNRLLFYLNANYFLYGAGGGVGSIADTNWHHVVMKIDDKGDMAIYKDGINVSGPSATKTDPIIAMGQDIDIGNTIWSWQNLNGSLENLYIWNTTLTAEEIQEVYRASRFNTEGNTVNYYGRYTNAVDSGFANTTWKNFSWLETEPTGTNISVRYRLGNYTPVDTSDSDLVSYWKLNRSDGTNAFANANPDNNQVLHLKFNNLTDFNDYSGQGNTGTNSGSAYTDLGYIGGARSFDGTNDYVDLDAHVNSVKDLTTGTVTAWVKPASAGTTKRLISTSDSGDGSSYWTLYLPGANELYLIVREAGVYIINDVSTAQLPVNEWSFVVITQDSTNYQGYINGETAAGLSGANSGWFKNISDTDTFRIGNIKYSAIDRQFFHGNIDNVRIYNTSLNTTQIKELYSKEAGTYDSKNSNHGIATGTDRASGIFSNDLALEFNRDGDYVETGKERIGNNYSACFWAKSKEETLGELYFVLDSSYLTTYNGSQVYFYTNAVNWWMYVYFGNGTNSTGYTRQLLTTSPLNNWCHFCYVYNTTHIRYYQNANLLGAPAVITNIGFVPESTYNLHIGATTWSGNGWNGSIDSVALYNRTLSATEISDLYMNWSGWSAYYGTNFIPLSNQKSRAIQFQALLNTSNSSVTPVFGATDERYITPPHCGMIMTTSTNLTYDLDCNGTAIYIAKPNIYLNCKGYTVKGNGTGIGVKINDSDVNVTNCNIHNFVTDVYADPGTGLIIENNSIQNASNCTVLNAFNTSIIRNNTYYNCTDNAIILYNESFYNLIYNNSINFSNIGVTIINSTNNTVWNNSFYDSITVHANATTGNTFNSTTKGNYWDDITTLRIYDTDKDDMGDAGQDYPYKVTHSANVDGNVTDFRPFGARYFGCGANVTFNVTMLDNLDCNDTALNLVADSLRLDCARYIIRGDGAGLVGLKIENDNVAAANCLIYNFTTNIYADPGVGLKVQNNTLENSSNCTLFEKFNSSIISNNTYRNCTDNAILLINESNHNRIYNNTINLSWIGVNIRNGTNNTVWNNNFTNSLHLHANSITGNKFNTTIGNYWDDITLLRIYDTDKDDLGDAGQDYPYNSSNNANTTGTIEDYRPIDARYYGCGMNLTFSIDLFTNLNCNGTAINAIADNININCTGYSILGNGTGTGVKMNSSNINLSGCYIYNFAEDVVGDPGVGLIIENNSIGNASNCTVLEDYNSSIIRNNTYYNCTQNAILLINASEDNQIYRNIINRSYIAVNFLNGTNNTFWNNTINSSIKATANSIIGNIFNQTVGNRWQDILSLLIFDTDGDELGDAGSEYPYNTSNNANTTGTIDDERPFTTKVPGPFIVNITRPSNNSVSSANVNITCTVISSDLVNNLTYIVWNASGFVQRGSVNPGTANTTYSWIITLPDGNYTAGCNATNILNQRNASDENNTFIVDTVAPALKLVSPPTGTIYVTTASVTVPLTFQVNDTTSVNCSIDLNDRNVINFTNLASGTYSHNEVLGPGVYSWNVTCEDEAGWINSTPRWGFTVQRPPTGPTAGAGAGGSQRMNYNVNVESLCLNKKSKISVTPVVNGQIRVSYEQETNWIYAANLELTNGNTYFTPSQIGKYKFDLIAAGIVTGTTTANAQMCAMEERPFNIPLIDLERSTVAKEINQEQEETEEPPKEPEVKEATPIKTTPIISGLIGLGILGLLVFSPISPVKMRRRYRARKVEKRYGKIKQKFVKPVKKTASVETLGRRMDKLKRQFKSK